MENNGEDHMDVVNSTDNHDSDAEELYCRERPVMFTPHPTRTVAFRTIVSPQDSEGSSQNTTSLSSAGEEPIEESHSPRSILNFAYDPLVENYHVLANLLTSEKNDYVATSKYMETTLFHGDHRRKVMHWMMSVSIFILSLYYLPINTVKCEQSSYSNN